MPNQNVTPTVFTIRPGGISFYYMDLSQQESILTDGLTLTGTPSVTVDVNTEPPSAPSLPVISNVSIVQPSSQPVAASTVTSGQVTAVTLTSGGAGWPSPPAYVWVTFTGGGGSGAFGVATVSEGSVISVKVPQGGNGYTSAPTPVFNSACIQFLVTTVAAQAGFTFSIEVICGLSDGLQNCQGEGKLAVTW